MRVWILLLVMLVAPAALAVDNRPCEGVSLEAALDGQRQVKLRWNAGVLPPGSQLRLWRGTSNLLRGELDRTKFPVCGLPIPQELSGEVVDDTVADGTRYFYQIEFVTPYGTYYSNVAGVTTPNVRLPSLRTPHIIVDKQHYFLEVLEWGTPVKRYPIALGQDPFKRKLHQDNASTPEGVYRIQKVVHDAAYYRAYDLDYPNDVDRLRYDFARRQGLVPEGRGIGGEIQIHGDVRVNEEVISNWTHGCIAMRNADLDELFSHPEIQEGCWVYIVGRDLTRDDLTSVLRPRNSAEIFAVEQRLQAMGLDPGAVDGELDAATMRAIGDFQLRHGLPLTCELDERTMSRLLPTAGTR